ncbi:hypothetical protein EMCRGX_G032477 [Ephydatia muelleri]
MCYLLHTYHQMCPGLRIAGLLWEDGQALSDGKEDFWHALGRWSGPIRQLWRISGMLWEDGQAPSDSCGGGNADLLQEDGQAPSDSCGEFLACSGKMVRPKLWRRRKEETGPTDSRRSAQEERRDCAGKRQAPSDCCGGFLECSGKMVRPHQSAVEDFWSALGRWSGPIRADALGKSAREMVRPAMEDCWLVPGRWSGPIRQLWRISGLLQDDGQAPSDGCGGFLACSRTMVRSCTVDFGVLWEEGFNTYNGSDGHPGVLTGLDLWERRESHCPMLYSPWSPRRVILVYQGWLGLQAILGHWGLAPQVEGAPGTPEAAQADLSIPLRFLRLKYSSVRQNITYDCGSGVDGFTKMRHQAADSTTFQFGVGTEVHVMHSYVHTGLLACSRKMVRSMTIRISGVLWEDGQAPSDSCGEFLECSWKMIRPHQTAVEDALGR